MVLTVKLHVFTGELLHFKIGLRCFRDCFVEWGCFRGLFVVPPSPLAVSSLLTFGALIEVE